MNRNQARQTALYSEPSYNWDDDVWVEWAKIINSKAERVADTEKMRWGTAFLCFAPICIPVIMISVFAVVTSSLISADPPLRSDPPPKIISYYYRTEPSPEQVDIDIGDWCNAPHCRIIYRHYKNNHGAFCYCESATRKEPR